MDTTIPNLTEINGTNEFTTNQQMQAAWSNYQTAVDVSEKREAIINGANFFWHIAVLTCAIATVLLLCYIALRKKKDPSDSRQQKPVSKDTYEPNLSRDYEKYRKAKDSSQRSPDENVPPRLSEVKSTHDDSSQHPDSRYMPKN